MPPFLSQNKLACHEAVTIAQSVLQELLGGILTPERAQSPVDTYLTEEDLFHHRNPQVSMALPRVCALGERNSKPSKIRICPEHLP